MQDGVNNASAAILGRRDGIVPELGEEIVLTCLIGQQCAVMLM